MQYDHYFTRKELLIIMDLNKQADVRSILSANSTAISFLA